MTKETPGQCNVMCNCLYFTSNKLNRIITKIADEEFLKTGLSPSHALTLMNINNRPGLSQKELSKQMKIKPSTTTRFIDKLEAKGLVERKAKGKVSYLHPTPKGEELQKEIGKCWKSLHLRYSKILGEEESRKLTEKIDQCANLLEKHIHD